MTEASVSFAGNLADQPEVRYTEDGIARAMFRVAVSHCQTDAKNGPRGSSTAGAGRSGRRLCC